MFRICNTTNNVSHITISDFVGYGEDNNYTDFIENLVQIPKENKIIVHIHSNGGNFDAGLALYTALKGLPNHKIAYVDCNCDSAAVMPLLACNERYAGEFATIFIHPPIISTPANASADDLAAIIPEMTSRKDKMLSLYSNETHSDRQTLEPLINKKTKLTATEAYKLGFLTKIIPAADITNFINNLSLNNLQHTEETKNESKHNKENITNINMENNNNKDEVKQDVPQAVSTNGTPNVDNMSSLQQANNAMQAKLDALKKALQDEITNLRNEKESRRKLEIDNIVTDAMNAGKIKNTETDAWRAMLASNFEQAKGLIDNMSVPQKPVTVQVFETSPSVGSIAVEFDNLSKAQSIKQYSHLVDENKDKLQSFFKANKVIENANTVDSKLLRTTLLSTALEEFGHMFAPIVNMFTTHFSQTPVEGVKKLTIPYYPLTEWETNTFSYTSSPTGYAASAGDTQVSAKEIELTTRLYTKLSWNSDQAIFDPFLNLSKFYEQQAKNLGWKMYQRLLAQITSSNFSYVYPTAGIPLADFNLNLFADLRKFAVEDKKWGHNAIQGVVNMTYYTQLLKDPDIRQASVFGTQSTLWDNNLPMLHGIKMLTATEFPNNSQNLIGFVCLPTALGIVNCPITPVQGLTTIYSTYTEPNTGLTFSVRLFGDNVQDTVSRILEVNFGVAPIENKALIRLTSSSSAATTTSVSEQLATLNTSISAIKIAVESIDDKTTDESNA